MSNPFPNYRFLLATAAVVLLICVLAEAQTTRPAAGRGAASASPMLQRLEDRVAGLNLSDEQKVQFQALKDEMAETVRGLGPGLKDMSQQERREKVREALGDVREKFESILTPEQKKQLREQAGAQRPSIQRPLAQEMPSTQPATTAPGEAKGAGLRAGGETPMINRMRQAVEGLGLTPEQKPQVDAIFEDAAKQARELRKEGKGDREAVRDKVQAIGQGVREKLATVLTPEQRDKLRETMAARGGGSLGGGAGKFRTGGDPPTTKPAGPNVNNNTTPNTTVAKAAVVSSPTTQLSIGTPAPAFMLTRLSGTLLDSKSLRGKPTVLAFGSLTSPSFRDRLPKLEQLKNKYRSRANVLIIYTREAHPADGWQVDRNRDDKIEINAPTTMNDRMALATKLRDLSQTSLDIAVDGIDDKTLHAFGDTQEGAVVLSPMGSIVGTQTFCDPSGLPRMIDDAFKVKN